jgi:NAD(P)-dependent dehydrogenase (short-subunit alcohol dehydrogenase family)
MTGFGGKVAIVTGAARGIGTAFARALAERGAFVALIDLRSEEAGAVAESITARGGRAIALSADVADKAALAAAFEGIVRRAGRLDILINNVGIGTSAETASTPWWEWSPDAFERVLKVNLGGSFYGAQLAAPIMMGQGWGRIVNIGSATVWAPMAEASHYIASKAGLLGLTRALAAGLGNQGVTVNTLVPGLTRTEQADSLFPAAVFEAYRAMRSIPRDAHPQDLVGTMLYLCSPASDFITGQTFIVDGGHIFD